MLIKTDEQYPVVLLPNGSQEEHVFVSKQFYVPETYLNVDTDKQGEKFLCVIRDNQSIGYADLEDLLHEPEVFNSFWKFLNEVLPEFQTKEQLVNIVVNNLPLDTVIRLCIYRLKQDKRTKTDIIDTIPITEEFKDYFNQVSALKGKDINGNPSEKNIEIWCSGKHIIDWNIYKHNTVNYSDFKSTLEILNFMKSRTNEVFKVQTILE